MNKLYRCGWCGQSCNEKGIPLLPLSLEGQYYSADPVEGDCCREEQEEQREQRRITHERAMDA